jgi:hypothetical protein
MIIHLKTINISHVILQYHGSSLEMALFVWDTHITDVILQYHGSSLEMALFVWDTHMQHIYTLSQDTNFAIFFMVSLKTSQDHDRMVVRFTTTCAISAYHHWCCEFKSRSGRGVQYYMIKFVSDLQQVGGFLWVLWFLHQ